MTSTSLRGQHAAVTRTRILSAVAELLEEGDAEELTMPDVAAASDHHGVGGEQSRVVAPMPGTVIRLLVREGDQVQPRQPLVVLEAMKMETPLLSPYGATVRAVHVEEGATVAAGALLVELQD